MVGVSDFIFPIWWGYLFLACSLAICVTKVADGCVLEYICEIVEFTCPYGISAMWAIFGMLQPYFSVSYINYMYITPL